MLFASSVSVSVSVVSGSRSSSLDGGSSVGRVCGHALPDSMYSHAESGVPWNIGLWTMMKGWSIRRLAAFMAASFLFVWYASLMIVRFHAGSFSAAAVALYRGWRFASRIGTRWIGCCLRFSSGSAFHILTSVCPASFGRSTTRPPFAKNIGMIFGNHSLPYPTPSLK